MAEEEVTLKFLSAQMTTLIEYVQDLCGAADVLISICAGVENTDPAVLNQLAHLRRIRRVAEERTVALKRDEP
jgi:hypothetical protein